MGTGTFGAAVFVLTELALVNHPIQSEVLAQRLRMDGGVTRRILLKLNRHGMVRALRGPGGGSLLARSASEITLLDVRNAVETRRPAVDWRGRMVPASPAGRQLGELLAETEAEVDRATEAALAARTIRDLATEVERRQQEWRVSRARARSMERSPRSGGNG
jgi:Rrf2 family protein